MSGEVLRRWDGGVWQVTLDAMSREDAMKDMVPCASCMGHALTTVAPFVLTTYATGEASPSGWARLCLGCVLGVVPGLHPDQRGRFQRRATRLDPDGWKKLVETEVQEVTGEKPQLEGAGE